MSGSKKVYSADGVRLWWRPLNSQRVRTARQQERRGQRSGAQRRKWRRLRDRIFERDSYVCAYCGDAATTVDHIIAIANGGTDDEGNLVAACRPCNSNLGSMGLREGHS